MISLFIPWKEASFITFYFLNWPVKEKIFVKVLYLVFILSACGSWKSNFNFQLKKYPYVFLLCHKSC